MGKGGELLHVRVHCCVHRLKALANLLCFRINRVPKMAKHFGIVLWIALHSRVPKVKHLNTKEEKDKEKGGGRKRRCNNWVEGLQAVRKCPSQRQ